VLDLRKLLKHPVDQKRLAKKLADHPAGTAKVGKWLGCCGPLAIRDLLWDLPRHYGVGKSQTENLGGGGDCDDRALSRLAQKVRKITKSHRWLGCFFKKKWTFERTSWGMHEDVPRPNGREREGYHSTGKKLQNGAGVRVWASLVSPIISLQEERQRTKGAKPSLKEVGPSGDKILIDGHRGKKLIVGGLIKQMM